MKPNKSAETRARILKSALDLFREKGFEPATMREVAASAGLALGAAYYHFDSKESLVMAFYEQSQAEMAPMAEQALKKSRDARARIDSLIQLKLAYFAPSRALLGALAGFTNPDHPLSPFSQATRPIRDADIYLFRQALEGSTMRVSSDLMPFLPRLLWLYQMGIILFWINDKSPDQNKTAALLSKTTRLISRLLILSGLPLMRPLRKIVIDLCQTVEV